ncbi:MAG: DNA primase [Phycisphaerae bacterium]
MIGRAVEAVTDRIREASDIVDVVGACVALRRAGKDFKALCPFHSEKTPSFHVVPHKQIFHCFGCGAGGDVFKFIQLREAVGFREAREILAARAGIDLEPARNARAPQGPGKVEIERTNRWAAQWFRQQFESPAGQKVREYVSARGVTAETAATFGLGFAPDGWETLAVAAERQRIPRAVLMSAGLTKPRQDGSPYDAFRNRLMLPIRDVMGRALGFGGRTLGNDDAKYLNSSQNALFDKSRCLYGLETAREAFAESRTAIVVEGYTDAIMAQQCGFGNTVATLGTALTAEHVQVLRRYVDNVILVFDSDEAGQRAADRALEFFLLGRLEVRLAAVPEGKDPAEFLSQGHREAFERTLTSAIGALEFKWNQIRQRCGAGAGGVDQRQAIEDFLGLISRLMGDAAADPIQWGLVLNQLAKLLGLPREDVYRKLRSMGANGRRSRLPMGESALRRENTVRRPPNAAAAAMLDLLEVLLAEPGCYESVASQFSADLLPDSTTRSIGHAIVELGRSDGGLTLPALLSRFESVETARRITELQIRGERRGNYAATIESVVSRLEQLELQREADDLVTRLRRRAAAELENIKEKPDGSGVGEDEDDRSRLRAASQAVGQVNHFAARRHLAIWSNAGAQKEEPSSAR